jgi:hypothetical protein
MLTRRASTSKKVEINEIEINGVIPMRIFTLVINPSKGKPSFCDQLLCNVIHGHSPPKRKCTDRKYRINAADITLIGISNLPFSFFEVCFLLIRF